MNPPKPAQPWLLIAAAPAEVEALARGLGTPYHGGLAWGCTFSTGPSVWIARSGVGKVNAALAASRLASPSLFSAVLSVGICGALPPVATEAQPRPPLALPPPGTVIIATECVYGDEGVATPDRFLDCADIGFPLSADAPAGGAFTGSRIRTDERVRAAINAALPGAVSAPIATVSSCSGTDALAAAVAARTGAAAEAMEGAAIGHAVAQVHDGRIAFCEVRVVSNSTGDRARQRWDMRAALAGLERVAAAVATAHRAMPAD